MIQPKNIKMHDVDRLAHSLLAAATKAFEDPRIQEEFEEWLKRREKEANLNGAH